MKQPSSNLGLRHLALRVQDVTVVRHFYVTILGFSIEREIPGEELWLTCGFDSLVFLRDSAAETLSKALDHLGFAVPAASDVGKWESYLRAHDVPILEPTEAYDDGSVGLICADPVGLHVQVLWHPKIAA